MGDELLGANDQVARRSLLHELAAAWEAVHDATPEGWSVGRPYFDERHDRWEQYAYDPSEMAVVGKRSRDWTVVGPTELRCV